MSPILAGDLLLVQRDSTQYKVLAEELKGEPPPGGELWTPADLTNLVSWVDASDPLTLSETAGMVSEWRSQPRSGAAITNELGQTTGSLQPVYEPTGFDGTRPCVSFTNQHLFGRSPMVISKRDSAFFLVIKRPAATAGGPWASLGNDNGTTIEGSVRALWSPGAGTNLTFVTWFNDLQGNPIPFTADTPYIVYARQDSASVSIGLNGTSVTGSLGMAATALVSNEFSIGSLGGRVPSGAVFMRGKVAECLFLAADTGGTMTTGEVAQAEGYLAHKWGLTGSLPDDHPYKNAPPMKP